MVSRTAWIGVALVARLLMVAVLVTTAVRTGANHYRTRQSSYDGDSSHQLQSHTRAVILTPSFHASASSAPTCVDAAYLYMVCRLHWYTMLVAAAIGAAGSVLQIPVAVYLLGKNRRRMTPSALIVDISFWTDMVVTVVLVCAFVVGFATASDDDLTSASGVDESARRDLMGYYHRAKLPLALLFVGMLLSIVASLISAEQKLRLRDQATATNDDVAVADIV